MNERVTMLAGALGALALVVGLLLPTPQRGREDPSVPTSADRGALGLAGAKAWLEARGIATASLRVRYHGLQRLDAPARGNLLVVHLPRLRAARPDEREALRAWLRRGNTAVVLAAVARAPRWSRDREEPLRDGLSGLDIAMGRDTGASAVEPDDGTDEATHPLQPRARHPITAGVERLEVTAPFQPIERDADATRPWLALFGHGERASIFWRHYGDGAILASAHPGLFGNDAIRRADNAQLLANLVAHARSPSGRVIFDDFHLGLSRLYDAQALFADERLHATVALLLGFWLLYAVGHSNRLAPPRRARPRPTARDFTEAVAGLLARDCDRVAAGRALLAHFFDGVRRRYGLPENGEPAWDCLRADTAIDAARIDRLRRLADRIERGHRVSLTRLNREIAHIEELLR